MTRIWSNSYLHHTFPGQVKNSSAIEIALAAGAAAVMVRTVSAEAMKRFMSNSFVIAALLY